MKSQLKYLLPLLLLASCIEKKSDNTPPALYPQPQTVELNTNGGYILNTVTGDSLKPILTKNGDTLQTGVPIPVQRKIIQTEGVAKPKSSKVLHSIRRAGNS